MAETDFAQSESGIWHLRGAEGDHLSERSEGRKLPQQMPRCPRRFSEIENALRGWFGGDARGAAKGAKPHNRPRLAARRAGVPTSPEGEIVCPKGSEKIKIVRHLTSVITRRTGGPTSPVGEPSCPQGRKIKGKPRADAVELRAVQAPPPSPSGEIP